MKKFILLSIAVISASVVFAEDWVTTINDAPDGATYLINGKTVKKAVPSHNSVVTRCFHRGLRHLIL